MIGRMQPVCVVNLVDDLCQLHDDGQDARVELCLRKTTSCALAKLPSANSVDRRVNVHVPECCKQAETDMLGQRLLASVANDPEALVPPRERD